jgi:cytochrome c-type biogenesis protein CcmH
MKKFYLVVLMVLGQWVHAGVEYRQFDNPEQEKAYTTLIDELRCLVCQNQTIADSNADLAKDLRRQVYEMLQQGKSQQDIVDFMTGRYGDFVMYRPPLSTKTLFLWGGPLLFVVLGLIMLVVVSRRKRKANETQLSVEKKARIESLLNEGDDA